MIAVAAFANLTMWASAVATILDSASTAAVLTAIITGVFGLLNTALQTVILRQARRNAELAVATRTEVHGAREVAHESVQVLREATGTEKRKSGTDRRGDGGGRRRVDQADGH